MGWQDDPTVTSDVMTTGEWQNDPIVPPESPQSVPGFDLDTEEYYKQRTPSRPEPKTFMEQVKEDIPK